MTDVFDIGKFAKPAEVLIERISGAIGGVFKPWQIRRVAQAEAEAEKIKEISRIEISELSRRAVVRFMAEEAKKQANIESIILKALSDLNEKSRPAEVEEDWISNFFDKCRLISDVEMQNLWAKILAGEANSPNTYSKRTVNSVGSLDKTDATLFATLCSYGWTLNGGVQPLIYDCNHEIYKKNGINFDTLKHLDAIGLISFESIAGFVFEKLPQSVVVSYFGQQVNVRFADEKDNKLKIGQILLTKTGRELALICGSKPVPEIVEYVLGKWSGFGYVISKLA